MLSVGEDVEANALSKRGWTVSAIARHLGRDRKTVRSYLSGERVPGVRRPARPDALADYRAYVVARFDDDPHLWASALFDEVVALGYGGSYVSFARQVRLAGLRPHCECCSGVKGRETIEIDHPAGEEIQWDWFERRKAPWGATAYVLLGTLSHSGRTRGVLAESMDQAHLIEAMDAVMRRLGGTAREVAHRPPGHRDRARQCRCAGQLRPRGQVLRGHNHPVPAPAGEPQGCRRVRGQVLLRALVEDHDGPHPGRGPGEPGPVLVGHRRRPAAAPGTLRRAGRARRRAAASVAERRRPGGAEVLMALPAVAYPATIEVTRHVDERASVAFRGNRYSLSPGMTGTELTLRHRLGTGALEVFSPAGALLVSHRLARPGAGQMVRTAEHRAELEAVVLGQFSFARPCDRKANKPPGRAALAERARLLGPAGDEPTVDLDDLAEVIALAFPGSTQVSA